MRLVCFVRSLFAPRFFRARAQFTAPTSQTTQALHAFFLFLFFAPTATLTKQATQTPRAKSPATLLAVLFCTTHATRFLCEFCFLRFKFRADFEKYFWNFKIKRFLKIRILKNKNKKPW